MISVSNKKINSTPVPYFGMDAHTIGYATVFFSMMTIGACLMMIPILSYKLNTWKMDMELQIADFKEITDMSWSEMMRARELLGNIKRGRRQAPIGGGKNLDSGTLERSNLYYYILNDSVYSTNDRSLAASQYSNPNPGLTPPPAPAPITQAPATCDCPTTTPEDCPRGPAGPPGDNGLDGQLGLNGPLGAPGLDNEDMAPCAFPELPCTICPAGDPGPAGKVGPQGHLGTPGQIGRPAFPGRNGRDGAMGNKGAQGIWGKKGKDGMKGLKGLDVLGGKGKPGVKGQVGVPGIQGNIGKSGRTVKQAARQGGQGPRGLSGSPGFGGRKGTQGPSGFSGNPGNDAGYCTCPDRMTAISYENGGGPLTATRSPAPYSDSGSPTSQPDANYGQNRFLGRRSPAGPEFLKGRS